MNSIRVGVYSEHKLILEGVCRLLDDLENIQVLLKETTLEKLLKSSGMEKIQILILNPENLDTPVLNLIVKINVLFPKVMVLILSSAVDELIIHKTIKAGARGFLSRDSDSNDLLEALYTLRNGHDYYSKSITQLLLKRYISSVKSGKESPEQKDLACLSSREREVLALWGNSFTNNEISEQLFISIRTVESHKNHIMQKLNLRTAVDMVKFAIRNSIIEL
jgi:DNA-binding NarL/FixJ family response regulator